jgi:hypothetical protein
MNRFSSAIAIAAISVLSACHQEERPEPTWSISSQQLQVEGKQEVLFTLPDNFQKEEPIISAKPANAATAELFQNDAGMWTLRYQSVDGRPGLDLLSIDSEDEEAEKASHQGRCGGNGQPGPFGHHKDKHPEMKGHYRLQVEILVKEVKDTQQKQLSNSNIQ